MSETQRFAKAEDIPEEFWKNVQVDWLQTMTAWKPEKEEFEYDLRMEMLLMMIRMDIEWNLFMEIEDLN